MKSKESLSKAINDTISIILKNKKKEQLDIDLFVNQCIKEFNKMDLPFYSIELDKTDKTKINLEIPFAKKSFIKIEQYKFGDSHKCAFLYVNNNPVRKIKFEQLSPEYTAKVAHGLLDYLKRYTILKNKFNSD